VKPASALPEIIRLILFRAFSQEFWPEQAWTFSRFLSTRLFFPLQAE
jgi:hypothetical protein